MAHSHQTGQFWTLVAEPEKTAGAKALDIIAMHNDYGFSYTHLAQLNQRQIDTLRLKCEARTRQAAVATAAAPSDAVADAVAAASATLAAQAAAAATAAGPTTRVKTQKKRFTRSHVL